MSADSVAGAPVANQEAITYCNY